MTLPLFLVGCGGGMGRGVNNLNLLQAAPFRLATSGAGSAVFTSDGAGHLTANLGLCSNPGGGPALCQMQGVARGDLEGYTLSGYRLVTPAALPLPSSSGGTYTVDLTKLTPASVALNGPTGASVFTGRAESLTFTQTAPGSVTLDIRLLGGIPHAPPKGGIEISVAAQIQLGPGDTLAAVASTKTPTAVGGVFVP